MPGIDTILRYPIEVWVSSGKEFVAPEIVESKIENRRKKRAFRSAVSLELDIEKHILRQMKGMVLYFWIVYFDTQSRISLGSIVVYSFLFI